ncbi:MAG TPA: nuclear transport factor 2 family protein [Pyrinomonadaceae bacterium]|nr:nuclear transport factor 2 family protein [Pyrinomonadaceae bacterium]
MDGGAPGVLTWRPNFADVSQAGDLGYTTGPWEFREKSLEEKPVAHGQFMTIWKRQADGTWKFALDLGTRNPPPEASSSTEVQFPSSRQRGKKLNDGGAGEALLLKAESELAKKVASKKPVDAFLSYMSDDVRFMRPNAFPVVGREAARSALNAKPGALTWQPTKAEVARSGDLGYVYGTYEFKSDDGKTSEKGNYVRIWKRQAGNSWKIVLDLLNPIPPARAN